MYFEVAEALPKEQFLNVYKEITKLSSLIFAPFGFPLNIEDHLGEKETKESLDTQFQHWEDVISKKMFQLRGYDESIIVASLHKYLAGDNQDEEVFIHIQAASEALSKLVSPPRVIDFDNCGDSIELLEHATSAFAAARLLGKLITALKFAMEISDIHGKNNFAYDTIIYERLKLKIPVTANIPTTSNNSSISLDFLPKLTEEKVQALLQCLSLDVEDFQPCGFNPVERKKPLKTVIYSTQQFLALLDIHGESPEVKGVLSRHSPHFQTSNQSLEPTTRGLKNGFLLPELNISLQPSIAFLSQLADLTLAEAEKTLKKDDTSLQERRIEALDFTYFAILKRREAKEAAIQEDFEEAIDLLTNSLLDEFDIEIESGVTGGGDNYVGLIPNSLLAQLYTDRAEYKISVGMATDALTDVDKALLKAPLFAPAYSLRANLAVALQEQGDEDLETLQNYYGGADIEEKGKGSKKLMRNRVKVLLNAAEDALLAFLLGGSSDLELASAAEEASRESCRSSAKAIFRMRNGQLPSSHEKPQSDDDDEGEEGLPAVLEDLLLKDAALTYNHAEQKTSTGLSGLIEGVNQASVDVHTPRSWLISSYFCGYEMLSIGMGLYSIPPPNDRKKGNGDSGGDPGGLDDIDDVICQQGMVERDLLPAPPSHLLEREGNCDTYESGDKEAFQLLCWLVDAFEGVALKGEQLQEGELSVPLSSIEDISESKSEKLVLDLLNGEEKVPLELFTLLKGNKAGSVQKEWDDLVVDQGPCIIAPKETNGLIKEEKEGKNEKIQGDVFVPPCPVFITIVQKLRIDGCCGTPVSKLTGVEFRNNGTITNLSNPVQGVSNSDDTPLSDVSPKIRARLQSLCGSVAYLAGDALGSVSCFESALLLDPALNDCRVKLGALLVDMDEPSKAEELLEIARERAPMDPVIPLHIAELEINQNKFNEATNSLRSAKRLLMMRQEDENYQYTGSEGDNKGGLKPSPVSYAYYRNTYRALFCPFLADEKKLGVNSKADKGSAEKEYQRRCTTATRETGVNIFSLLGISMFRLYPTKLELSMRVLSEGIKQYPNATMLLICSGEIHSQAGDMINALENFHKASIIDPDNPLPYVHAARSFQQLSQLSTSQHHLEAALRKDASLALTRVDFAQNQLQQVQKGLTPKKQSIDDTLPAVEEKALFLLDEAMGCARQVSEIRDVLTARVVALLQRRLVVRGLYKPLCISI